MVTSHLRSIGARTSGHPLGPITRLISPDHLGRRLKPFVFLDFFSADITPGFGFGMHPHSGIATLTWQPSCDVRYEDTTGKAGLLEAGGLEWMNAGGGAWHQGWLQGTGPAIGFQLWVPMPPGVEDGAALAQYVPPAEVPSFRSPGGHVKVLLGSLGSPESHIESPIHSHQDMNYLALSLEAYCTWSYKPPLSHKVAWAFVFEGKPAVQHVATHRELLIFEGSGEIEITTSNVPTRILLGSAKPHEFPLVLGAASIHTNPVSLARGEAEKFRIGAEWAALKS